MEVRNENKLEKLNEDVLSEIVGGLESWRPFNSTILKDNEEKLIKNDEKDKLVRYEEE